MKLTEILANLTEMAKSDGKVTKQEEKFLATLRKNIETFRKSADNAVADNQISDDEFEEMIILRDRILGDAISFETESKDVKNLVNELYGQINQFVIPGMADEELIDNE